LHRRNTKLKYKLLLSGGFGVRWIFLCVGSVLGFAAAKTQLISLKILLPR
jgi:hypothetical protein